MDLYLDSYNVLLEKIVIKISDEKNNDCHIHILFSLIYLTNAFYVIYSFTLILLPTQLC